MKRINIVSFEEAQVENVQQIHHPFCSQATQLPVRKRSQQAAIT